MISTVEQAAVGRLATVRLLTGAADGPVIDLLFASSGIEAEVIARAERLEVLEGLEIPVATTPDLITLKLLSRDDDHRPQDLVDLRGLIAPRLRRRACGGAPGRGADHGAWLPSGPRPGPGARTRVAPLVTTPSRVM